MSGTAAVGIQLVAECGSYATSSRPGPMG